ncbi:hypothetical protein AVEN_166543-1 [Araneus ventricosus]|uniref:Uncharacterized protein n=1 Tax=Araneus ventricosus TaxID=182803 RepID=A0A4Y2UJ77_ARAVE|nr:hypothetical protein AVEN_157560-1 [Araneus ventricosus]GBO13184.1 hypothetical protein AVEN_166543-1 [Araneus ventricosus]
MFQIKWSGLLVNCPLNVKVLTCTERGKRERSRLRDHGFPVSKSYCTIKPPSMWARCTLNLTSSVKHPPSSVVWMLGRGVQMSSSSSYG